MFHALGRGIARRPGVCLVVWMVLVAIGGTCALWGFGSGNLFSRMQSSTSMVPGSESDIVNNELTGDDAPQTYHIVTTGAEYTALTQELNDLHQALADLPGVESVADPLSVHREFEDTRTETIAAAVSQALTDNAATITRAEEQAVAELSARNPQIGMLPDSSKTALERQAREAAAHIARTQITDAATAAVEEEFSRVEDPADKLTSEDGFAIVVTLHPDNDLHETSSSALHETIAQHIEDFTATVREKHPSFTAHSASATIYEDLILGQVADDLVRGEVIGLPVALILLLVVFGGAIAAGLPIISALAAIAIAMGLIWGVTFFTNVDSFVLNILSIIGLALSIDYGLLIVSRYREQIQIAVERGDIAAQGNTKSAQVSHVLAQAIEQTVATAGRAVTYSALTIAGAISGLFAMKAPMLRMIAAGGVTVTLLAVLTAVTLVPSLLTLAGHRLVNPSLLTRFTPFAKLVQRFGDAATDTGIFSRLGRWVRRRPVVILTSGLLALIIFALPLHSLSMRSNFVEYIPVDSDAHIARTIIDRDYPELQTPTGMVIADSSSDNVDDLREKIESLDGITRVADPVELNDKRTLINYYMDDVDDQVGVQATNAMQEIRAFEDLPYDVYVGGAAALQYDFNASLRSGAPTAVLIIVLCVFVLLFLMTGSLIAPLTALVINTLSFLAGIGIASFIFEHGLFGLEPAVGLETFVVACAAAFGFGLAMDYEVFLLARIKESWDDGVPNDDAVVYGLQRSGRIITAAAAIIIAVFVGFVFAQMLAIKEIGVVLAIVVIVDASLVRMLIVPALMYILGRWNWWAPRFLRGMYEKFGLRE